MTKQITLFLFSLTLFACSRPIANFTMDKNEVVAPAEVVFTDQSQNAEECEWVFEDGESIKDKSATKRFSLSGIYKVKLVAKKGNKKSIMEKEIEVKAPSDCIVEIETSHGIMVAKLYDETPLHRDNFVKLASEGFFDGLLFHRVISGFMAQGGDPTSKDAAKGQPLGTGGPGYQIDAEIKEGLVHKKGALAAARAPDSVNPEKKSNGSQFYIVQGRALNDNQIAQIEMQKGIHYAPAVKEAYKNGGGTPFLDNDYTVFGEVISGIEILDIISEGETDGGDRPLEDVKMKIRVVK